MRQVGPLVLSPRTITQQRNKKKIKIKMKNKERKEKDRHWKSLSWSFSWRCMDACIALSFMTWHVTMHGMTCHQARQEGGRKTQLVEGWVDRGERGRDGAAASFTAKGANVEPTGRLPAIIPDFAAIRRKTSGPYRQVAECSWIIDVRGTALRSTTLYFWWTLCQLYPFNFLLSTASPLTTNPHRRSSNFSVGPPTINYQPFIFVA